MPIPQKGQTNSDNSSATAEKTTWLRYPRPPKQRWKLKFWKNKTNDWRCYPFTNVYHKWQSYDVWFLRYRAWQFDICWIDVMKQKMSK